MSLKTLSHNNWENWKNIRNAWGKHPPFPYTIDVSNPSLFCSYICTNTCNNSCWYHPVLVGKSQIINLLLCFSNVMYKNIDHIDHIQLVNLLSVSPCRWPWGWRCCCQQNIVSETDFAAFFFIKLYNLQFWQTLLWEGIFQTLKWPYNA